VAYGKGTSAAKLSVTLLGWSRTVTCCTDGEPLDSSDSQRLRKYGIEVRNERIIALTGTNGRLSEVRLAAGQPLACDALFFSSEQGQRSSLPQMLGCKCNDEGLVETEGKQGSGVRGLFLAGDADGDVQFAIVAAAEGAIAATAINTELQDEDYP
jgi:thioredoxin reductase